MNQLSMGSKQASLEVGMINAWVIFFEIILLRRQNNSAIILIVTNIINANVSLIGAVSLIND